MPVDKANLLMEAHGGAAGGTVGQQPKTTRSPEGGVGKANEASTGCILDSSARNRARNASDGESPASGSAAANPSLAFQAPFRVSRQELRELRFGRQAAGQESLDREAVEIHGLEQESPGCVATPTAAGAASLLAPGRSAPNAENARSPLTTGAASVCSIAASLGRYVRPTQGPENAFSSFSGPVCSGDLPPEPLPGATSAAPTPRLSPFA